MNHSTPHGEVTIDSSTINMEQPQHCSIATIKEENERLRTIVVIAGDNKLVVLDRELKLIEEFGGVAVEEMYFMGGVRSAVFGTVAGGKLVVWDFNKIAHQQPEYVLH